MQRETIERFIEWQSDVPKDLRDSDFQKEVKDLARRLLRWEMLELVAIHEAGHEMCYRKAGFADFKYVPPTVIYRPENKEKPFDGQIARIIPENYTKPDHDDWFLDLAKGYAAGGECSRRLTTTDYGGDTYDRTMWNDMCANYYKDSGLDQKQIEAIANDMWGKAQKAVGKDLESVRFRVQVHYKAKEITPQLFPWTKYT
jgi:hypothetical protein